VNARLSRTNAIEIWGDGEQTRSFTYIDDCLEGTLRLMQSDVADPINIGSDQLVTINQLVDIVEKIADVQLERRYKLDAPKGVRGRNSDNTMVKARLGWAPSVRLEDGMRQTYEWIYRQMVAADPQSLVRPGAAGLSGA
jgi:nucleoside-diphosphate-sugar epimerase